MRYESTFATDGYSNWKLATEMNRGFSKHAASQRTLSMLQYLERKESNGLRWARILSH